MMKNIVILPLICVILSSCEKKMDGYVPIQRCNGFSRQLDTVLKYINGTWIWKEGHFYNRLTDTYEIKTPGNSGYTQKLVFRDDTAWFYRTESFGKINVIEAAYKFRVGYEFEVSGIPTDSSAVIIYNELGPFVPIGVCEIQLSMLFHLIRDHIGEHVWIRAQP